MPTPMMRKLWSDPKFRALPPGAQMEVAARYVWPELQADPKFMALPALSQDMVRKRYALETVTFDGTSGYADAARGIAMDRLLKAEGNPEAKKFMMEGAFSLIQGSGIGSGLAMLLEGRAAALERRRILDFFKSADSMSGITSGTQAVGNFLGTLGDILGVNALMAPVTLAARGAVTTLARGGSALAKAGAALGRGAPIMHPTLEFLGGVAAESAVEAIPYFLNEEVRRAANGQESVISQGPMEVLKVLGINAAADFFVGSVMQAGLIKAGKLIFGKSDIYQAAFKSPEEFEHTLSQIRTGRADPAIILRASPIQQDAYRQRMAIDDFLRNGIADPEAQHWTRDAFLAHDMGKIVGRAEDGSYRVWSYAPSGRPVARTYQNITDMENFLAYDAYNVFQKLPVEQQGNFLRAHTSWALPRGKVLFEQQALLGSVVDPDLVKRLAKDRKLVPVSARPVITQGEAQGLARMSGETTTVIQTKLPLKGGIVENVNAAEINLMKGTESIRVSQMDQPNAIFIGKNAAPPEAYTRATEIAQRAIEVDPSITLTQSRSSTLLNQGFDHFKHPDGSVEFFAPRNMKLIGTPEDILTPSKAPLKAGQASPIAILTESRAFSAGGKTLAGNEDLSMSAAVTAIRTKSPKDITNFAKLYASGRGENLEVIVRTVSDIDAPKVTRAGDRLLIQMPEAAADFANEKRFVGELMKGLDEAVTVGPVAKSADYWASKFVGRNQVFNLPFGIPKSNLIKTIASQFNGIIDSVDGKTLIKLPSGDNFAGTEDMALNWLIRRVGDQTIITDDLRSQGIKISRIGTGVRAASLRNGKLISSAPSMPELLDKLDYIPKQLDLIYGPKVIEIGPDGFRFEIAGTKLFKNQKDAFEALSKFKDNRNIASTKVLSSTAKSDLLAHGDGSYSVYLGEFGATRNFNSLPEAREFMRRGDDLEIEELRDIAKGKYADITIRDNKYIVTAGANRYVAQDLDELASIMKKMPDLEDSVPSLLDELDPTIEASVSDLVNTFKGMRRKVRAGPNPYGLPMEFEFDPKTTEAGIYDTGRKMFANFTSWIEGVSERTKNPGLAKVMYKFRDAYRQAQGATVFANRTLDTIFRGQNGKLLNRASRSKIFYHMGATSEADALIFQTQHLRRYGKALAPLTAEEEVVSKRLKDFIDSAGITFGIKYSDLITKYMPRLRDLVDPSNAELLNGLTTAQELVDRHWVGAVPKELKFWAEHARVEDVTRFFLKDDALEVMMLYMAQGNKKYYLNEPWKEIQRFMTDTRLETGIQARVNMYRENIMSSYHSHGEKAIEDFGSKLFTGIKDFADKSPLLKGMVPFSRDQMDDMGRNILKGIMSTTYFATMGFKPMLAIRNSLAPWIMTAPRVGLSWVSKAYKDVLDNPKEIMERLRARNILSEKPPLVNQMFGHETAAGRFLEKSMESFKNSEDFTRAVAYRAGELRFQNAVDAWKLKRITTPEQLADLSGLDVMDPTTVSETMALFSRSDDLSIASAMDVYANKLQRDTMFDYSGTDTPGAFQGGFLGKLFGQYGTYSAGYRANIANMFKYGPVAKRAQMVATYLVTTGALYAGFEAMRIKTNDFIPFLPASFTGGPLFDMAIDAVKSTDPSGYEGAQARARLGDQFTSLLPGSAQVRALKKSREMADAGDTYGALLALMMTPVKPLW